VLSDAARWIRQPRGENLEDQVIGVVLVVIPGTGRIIQLRIVARRHCLGAQTAAAPAWPKDASSPAPNRDGK
jgi:hypothetical protein